LEGGAAVLRAAETLHDLDRLGGAGGAGEHLGPTAESDDTDLDAIAGHEFLIAEQHPPRMRRADIAPALMQRLLRVFDTLRVLRLLEGFGFFRQQSFQLSLK